MLKNLEKDHPWNIWEIQSDDNKLVSANKTLFSQKYKKYLLGYKIYQSNII